MRLTIIKFLLIACCCGTLTDSLAQKDKVQYVMLDMLDSLDKHSKWNRLYRYTLKTEELYGVDETIEMYNFYLAGELILFSILPDFTSEKNWSEVKLEDIQDDVLADERALRTTLGKHSKIRSRAKATKTHLYTLVKREGEKYFKSNFCLTEFFFIDTYPSLFNIPYGTINIGQDTLSIKQMMGVYWKALNIPEHWRFPLDVRKLGGTLLLPNRPILQREYMSRVLNIDSEKAYQFWTFTDWNTHDGYNLHRGVDRFIYMPNKGIVAGSYDFWFFVL